MTHCSFFRDHQASTLDSRPPFSLVLLAHRWSAGFAAPVLLRVWLWFVSKDRTYFIIFQDAFVFGIMYERLWWHNELFTHFTLLSFNFRPCSCLFYLAPFRDQAVSYISSKTRRKRRSAAWPRAYAPGGASGASQGAMLQVAEKHPWIRLATWQVLLPEPWSCHGLLQAVGCWATSFVLMQDVKMLGLSVICHSPSLTIMNRHKPSLTIINHHPILIITNHW